MRTFLLLGFSIAAILSAVPASAQLSEVRINEVLYDPLGADSGNQKVEIINQGGIPVDIGELRICENFRYRGFPPGVILQPGTTYTVHVRANGTNDGSNFYTTTQYPALGTDSGSFGLYKTAGLFTDPDAILDFVQWGGTGEAREDVAIAAQIWPMNDFTPDATEGLSIQRCTEGAGSSGWLVAAPTVGGTNSCSVATETVTWGALKAAFD